MNNKKQQNSFFIVFITYLWLIAFVFLPFIVICLISFSPKEANYIFFNLFDNIANIKNISFPTISNYSNLFSEELYINGFLSSLKLAIATTILTLLISYPIAYFIFKQTIRTQKLLLGLILIPYWTAFLIRVYALIMMFKNGGIINFTLLKTFIISEPIIFLGTKTAVIITMVYTYLPFMIIPIYNSVKKIEKTIIEAAKDLGCSEYSTIKKVIIPLSKNGVFAGVSVVFILSIGEFIIPDLIGNANIMTIGKILISEFFYSRDITKVATITTSLIVFVMMTLYCTKSLLNEK